MWIELDAPITFQAGQYIGLQVPGEAAARSFSIASAPGDGREIELNVRLVPGAQRDAVLRDYQQATDRTAQRDRSRAHMARIYEAIE